jgi:hypothetical protein
MNRDVFDKIMNKLFIKSQDFPYKELIKLKKTFLNLIVLKGGPDGLYDVYRCLPTIELLKLREKIVKYYAKLKLPLPMEIRVQETLKLIFDRYTCPRWTYRDIRQHVRYCSNEVLEAILEIGLEKGAYTDESRFNKRRRAVRYWHVADKRRIAPIDYDHVKFLLEALEEALGLEIDEDRVIVQGVTYLLSPEDLEVLKAVC